MATHSFILPGKCHGQRSLVSYGPQDCKESDTTERVHTRTHSGTAGYCGVWCLLLVILREWCTTKPEADAKKLMGTIEDNNWYCFKAKKEDTAFIIIWVLLVSSHPPASSPFSHITVFWVSGHEGYIWANACQKSMWMKNKRILINSHGLCSHQKTKIQKSCLVCLSLKWDITVFKDFR